MIRAGMNAARLNFSHGSHDQHSQSVKTIRRLSKKYNAPVAIVQDLRGLKIRVGSLKNGAALLRKGDRLVLTAKKIQGDRNQIPVPWKDLTNDINVGDTVLMDDGLLRLKVIRKGRTTLGVRVVEGGVLREKKGVNLPGTAITGDVFTRKDREDLRRGIELGIDYVAMSFVRSGDDIRRIKRWLRKQNTDIPVIAKIENRQSLENIDGIIEASDGLMVARGDLGVEVPMETVPMIQKELIRKCNEAMKPVITATQMLESMTEHATPTRAEAADVANAVIDGTDALMLSAETSVGKHPFGALQMMDKIIAAAESKAVRRDIITASSSGFAQALAEAACASAGEIGVRTIVAFSRSGFTALLVSKYRPAVSITAFTDREHVRRRMNLYWGVTPHVMKFPENTDTMISESEKVLLKKGLVKKGDPITIIASSPFSLGGKTNLMKLHRVGY
jgi:pyruvate kinase